MKRSPLLPRHEAAGARVQAQADPPFVLTYGDVPAEYEAATSGCALFDFTDRGRVRLGGSEARVFLHRLLANDVRGLEPGGGNRNLLLTPKGKIRHDFELACTDDGFVLSTPPGDAGPLCEALDTYLFTEDVQITDETDAHAPLGLCGPRAEDSLAELLSGALPAGDHDHATLELDGQPVHVTRLAVCGSPGFHLDAGPDHVEALWSALTAAGARPTGVVVRDILRVEAGAALPHVDIDENVYPQEARLEPAFSLEKGCYIGQEVVAKIDTYGGLNKRLVALRLDDDEPVARGTPVVDAAEDRELGMVTSWAYSFVLDTGLALAYVKRRHQAVGTEFRIGETRGRIVSLPVREGAVAISGEVEG